MNPLPQVHELGIMTSALDLVLEQARTHGARRVHRIVLRIGSLAGVEPDALRFAFEVATRDTPAAEATLDVTLVPCRAHCQACNELFEAEGGFIFACPRCGALSGDLRQGREMELAQIEMS